MPEPNDTTETLIDGELVLYERPGTDTWQCRFKIGDDWIRRSTKHTDKANARAAAYQLFYETNALAKAGVPITKKTFKTFAELAIQRMKDKIDSGNGMSVYKEHIGTIQNYLIPALGRKKISDIDKSALEELDSYRIEKMGKRPKKSTIQSHNAALGLVFSEAIDRGHLKEYDRPRLRNHGSEEERRPAFSLEEYKELIPKLTEWANETGIREISRNRRLLLSDFAQIALATGARPGKELEFLQWKHVDIRFESTEIQKTQTSSRLNGQEKKLRRISVLEVTHRKAKRSTDKRWIIGNDAVYLALQRIARRNYPEKWASKKYHMITGLRDFLRDHDIGSDFVFCTPGDSDYAKDLGKVWDRFLKKHELTHCPKTGQRRPLYSLRHTYVTLSLTYNGTDRHTLARQIGSSVEMIEKHYSHVDTVVSRKKLYDDGLLEALEKLSLPMQDPDEPPDGEYM